MSFNWIIGLSLLYLLSLGYFINKEKKARTVLLLKITFVPSFVLIYAGLTMMNSYDIHFRGNGGGRWGFLILPIIEYWPYFLCLFGTAAALFSLFLLRTISNSKSALTKDQLSKFIDLVEGNDLLIDISELPVNKSVLKNFLAKAIDSSKDKSQSEQLTTYWLGLSRFQSNVNEMNIAKQKMISSEDINVVADSSTQFVTIESETMAKQETEQNDLILEYKERWGSK